MPINAISASVSSVLEAKLPSLLLFRDGVLLQTDVTTGKIMESQELWGHVGGMLCGREASYELPCINLIFGWNASQMLLQTPSVFYSSLGN